MSAHAGDELPRPDFNTPFFCESFFKKLDSGKEPRHHGQVNAGPVAVEAFMSGPHGTDRNGVGTFLKRDPCGNSAMYASKLFCR